MILPYLDYLVVGYRGKNFVESRALDGITVIVIDSGNLALHVRISGRNVKDATTNVCHSTYGKMIDVDVVMIEIQTVIAQMINRMSRNYASDVVSLDMVVGLRIRQWV